MSTRKVPIKSLAAVIASTTTSIAYAQTCESPYVVTSVEPQSGFLTLIEALNAAEVYCSDFLIQIDDSLSGQTIPAEISNWTITGTATLLGPTNESVVISASDSSSALIEVAASGSLTLKNIDFDGTTNERAKIISTSYGSALHMDGVSFSNFSSFGTVDADGSIRIISSHFESNDTPLSLRVFGSSSVEIRDTQFSNNGNPAYIFIGAELQEPIEIKDSIFENSTNSALNIVNESSEIGTVFIEGSTFTGNSVNGRGGAIYFGTKGELNIVDSTFNSNQTNIYESASWGGAIYAGSGSVSIEKSLFINNSAVYGGGALQFDSISDLRIANTSFIDNTSPQGAGAIELENASTTVSISHSSFFFNQAFGTNRSAILDINNIGQSTVELSHIVLSNNTSGEPGHICFRATAESTSSELTIQNSFIDIHYSDSSYCKIAMQDEGGNTFGTTSVPIDPMVTELLDFDNEIIGYTPTLNSPLLNGGDASIENAPELDQQSNARISRGIVDIGAIEYQNTAPEASVPANLDFLGVSLINFDISHYFSDPEGDEITFFADGLPDGLALDINSGIISGNVDSVGSDLVHIAATDKFGGSISGSFNLNISNNEPAHTIPPYLEFEPSENVIVDLTPLISDSDGTTPIVDIADLPVDFNFSENIITAAFSNLTPGQSYPLTITISDDFTSQTVNTEVRILPTPTPTPVPTNIPSVEPTTDPTATGTPEPTTIPNNNMVQNDRSSGGGGATGIFSIALLLLTLLGSRRKKLFLQRARNP